MHGNWNRSQRWLEGDKVMATCKENCIHYSVCGMWDRKVFVDYEKDILSDFSDLPNVEEYCRNYLSKQVEAEWIWKTKIEPQAQNRLYCSSCDNECLSKNNYYVKSNWCPHCGAKMVGRK